MRLPTPSRYTAISPLFLHRGSTDWRPTRHGWNNVPFYTIHKILAGLVDTYKYGGLDEALDIAIDMSDLPPLPR